MQTKNETSKQPKLSEWDIYHKVNGKIQARDFLNALKDIEIYKDETVNIRGAMNRLEAHCYSLRNQNQKALEILESNVEAGYHEFWDFYELGNLYTANKNYEKSRIAFQKAHGVAGWFESEKNNYWFQNDYFSPNIVVWKDLFEKYITMSPINALEIGSWQGGSASWLLDKIISKRGGSLTCIDTFEGSSEHQAWIGGIGTTIEEIFDHNIKSTGHKDLVIKLKGYSQQVLRTLHGKKYDFIYIDGAHEARYVIEDAVLSYGLIDKGGLILFDDYPFEFAERPHQNSAVAIDAFIKMYQDEIEVLLKGRQVLIRKIV